MLTSRVTTSGINSASAPHTTPPQNACNSSSNTHLSSQLSFIGFKRGSSQLLNTARLKVALTA